MTDAKTKTLSEKIDEAGTTDHEVIWEIRRQHEEETGIPMEEDDLGKGEEDVVETMLPEIEARLDDAEAVGDD